MIGRWANWAVAGAAVIALALPRAGAQDQRYEPRYETWPTLKSTFPSTGGGGVMIKGYDPVIMKGKCLTTFMAQVPPDEVYFNVVEYDAVPAQGGTLCQNGRWTSFDGKSSGTTPFRMFFKDGVFRAAPG
jgi:hypothetical protein